MRTPCSVHRLYVANTCHRLYDKENKICLNLVYVGRCIVAVDVCSHPSASSVSNSVKVRFTPPKDIPVELYIKVFVGYKNRYSTPAAPRSYALYSMCGAVCREHNKIMYKCICLAVIWSVVVAVGVVTASSELQKILFFLAPSVCGLFVCV